MPQPSTLDQILRHLARVPPSPPPPPPPPQRPLWCSCSIGTIQIPFFGRSGDGSGPLGRFGRLPTEINFMIFACLSLDDVGNFALTSKRAKALAAGYLASRACLRRVLSLPSKMGEVSQCCLLNLSKCTSSNLIKTSLCHCLLKQLTTGHTLEGCRVGVDSEDATIVAADAVSRHHAENIRRPLQENLHAVGDAAAAEVGHRHV